MELLFSLLAVAISLVAVVMARAAQTETLSQTQARELVAELSDMMEMDSAQRARDTSRKARDKKRDDPPPSDAAPEDRRPVELLDKRELQRRARQQGLS